MRLRVILDLADKALAPLKRISQGSSETAQTLKVARDQLKQLDATQKAVGAFRETRAGLGETEAKLQAARERVKQLALQFNQAGVPTKAMTTAMAAARTEANQLGAKFNSQQQHLQQLRDKLQTAGISTKNLAEHDKQLRASMATTRLDIAKQTQALKAQADMQQRVAGIKQAQANNVAARGNARGALLDGVALAAALGAPIKMAIDWEQRLAELNKVAGKTPEELNSIAFAAQKLAVETGVAREEIIGAYIAASQAGFDESEWAKFAEVSAKMGVAFDTTGEKAGEMLKAWRAGMNLSMDEAAALAGAVNHIANNMNATANDIGDVLLRQGAVMKSMGLSDTQAAALAATMLSGGATSEIAATAGKNFMGALTKGFAATKGQREIWEMIGLNPEKVAKDMQKAPQQAIKAVLASLKTLEKHELAPAISMLFGQESVGAASQIVGNIDGLLKAFNLAGDSAQTLGSLQAEFDSMGGTSQQQMKKMGEVSKVLITTLGEGLLPALKDITKAVIPVVFGMAEWMQNNQGLVTVIVATIAGLMAFKIAAIAFAYGWTFLKGAWLAGRAVLMTLRTAMMLHTGAMVASTATSRAAIVMSKGLAAAQWLVNAAMSANPIGLLIIAIGLLIAAGVLLWKNWDEVVAGAKLVWQDLSNFLGNLWSSIATTASTAWAGMVQNFTQFGSWIIDGIIGGITNRLAALKETIVGAASSAANWFKEKLGIASPSKVFTQFGGWISEGAAKGIEAGQASVRAASVAMAAAALAPATAATGSAGSAGPAPTLAAAPVIMAKAPAPAAAPAGGNTYTITIQAAPGADPNAIARAVAAELDKRERAANARSRSALYDTN